MLVLKWLMEKSFLCFTFWCGKVKPVCFCTVRNKTTFIFYLKRWTKTTTRLWDLKEQGSKAQKKEVMGANVSFFVLIFIVWRLWPRGAVGNWSSVWRSCWILFQILVCASHVALHTIKTLQSLVWKVLVLPFWAPASFSCLTDGRKLQGNIH